MNRRFCFTTGMIGAFALFVAVNTVDVHAQRGAGIGHASAPTHTGQGRPATAGRPTVADQLSREHGLATQLQKVLPDTDLIKASEGFDNLGQFVAAAHVADNNPNFTFEELAAKMHDGDGMSLGGAIHALDPQADADTEVETAQTQAAADLKAAGKKK